MIENVLKDVAAAEGKAAEIRRQADADGAKIVEDANETALKIKDAGAKKAKMSRLHTLNEAKAQADEEYSTAIAACEKECAKFINDNYSKIERYAAEIVGRIINGNSQNN